MTKKTVTARGKAKGAKTVKKTGRTSSPRDTDVLGRALRKAYELKGVGGSLMMGRLDPVRVAVEEGIPVEAVKELQGELKRLGVPRPSEYVDAIASRASRARRDRLRPSEGEKLVRVAAILARAAEVWEDEEDAAAFLTSPHPALGGDAPIHRAQSEIGARQVEELLLDLDLGLPV